MLPVKSVASVALQSGLKAESERKPQNIQGKLEVFFLEHTEWNALPYHNIGEGTIKVKVLHKIVSSSLCSPTLTLSFPGGVYVFHTS